MTDPAWVEDLRSRLPELAVQRRKRLAQQYGLPSYDAGLLTSSKAMADYYEGVVGSKQLAGNALEKFAKSASNWILGDLSRLLNLEHQDISQTRVSPAHLVQLIDLVDRGVLGTTIGKTVLEEAFYSGDMPEQIVHSKGYSQIDDASVVQSAVAQAIEANPKAVDDYLQGKDTAARFLVGQVMKITQGRAKPGLVNRLIQEGLQALKN